MNAMNVSMGLRTYCNSGGGGGVVGVSTAGTAAVMGTAPPLTSMNQPPITMGTTTTMDTANATADPLIVPFPDLPPNILQRENHHRRHGSNNNADEERKAEGHDVRMYARLVYGMQSRAMMHAARSSGGYGGGGGYDANHPYNIHPLTQKSLMGVVSTKNARDEELLGGGGVIPLSSSPPITDANNDVVDSGWEMSYIDEEDECSDGNFYLDPASRGPQGWGHGQRATTSRQAKEAMEEASFSSQPSQELLFGKKTSSEVSMSTSTSNQEREVHEEEDDDDCLFSLEL
ncbi:predicted protein [Thalassiosira pseudonana CCMP1335]|uniref:Uncharacterized protein n=1 Tax=Thalassiosira pseudonana TaxID=35128 RepID=B8CDX8_THAPS|nr:predicted protein [Thalassiosira pseudonana CCMP1335]EED88283.1 predicted protein [Thalassiosira pseudonana CCMP1335]